MGAEGAGSTSGMSGTGGGGGGPGGGGGGPGGGGPGGGPGGPGGPGEFGLVLQELIKPGSRVKKGDTVAEFDRQNMLLRVDDYRVSVKQSDVTFRSLRTALDVNRKAHDQTIKSAKAAVDKARLDIQTTPVLGRIDSERLKLALEAAEARYKQLLTEVKFVDAQQRSQIRNAEIELEKTKIELQRSEANADRMVLKAPIDGLTVMQTIYRAGEFTQVQQGDQLMPGQLFMQIVDPSSMVVNANANQVDIERLRIGQRARVRFDAYPDLVLPARIEAVGGVPKQGGQRAAYVKELPVRLKMERVDARVIPDLSVSVEVIVDREENQPAVAPLAAIFRDADTPYVYVRNGEGWTRREVELGSTSFLEVAIKNGLKKGDIVALDRPPLARE
jgi:multidrug resistance efflux pump